MKVAAIQHDIVWEDPAANFARLAPMIGEAADAGARLAVLTEMYSTGFSMDTERIAEPFDGPSTPFLVEQATSHGMWVVRLGCPEREPGADKPVEHVRARGTRRHRAPVPQDPPVHVLGRARALRRGRRLHHRRRRRRPVLALRLLRPAVRRRVLVARRATDCYVCPPNWPASRRDHWRTLLRARAIENLAYVVGVNRVGTGGRLEYVGDSAVIGPFGEELADGDGRGEAVLVADVDPADVAPRANASASSPTAADPTRHLQALCRRRRVDMTRSRRQNGNRG